jgi:hypothetical protein
MERGPKVRGASRAHVHTHAKERNWGRTWLREGVSGWSRSSGGRSGHGERELFKYLTCVPKNVRFIQGGFER